MKSLVGFCVVGALGALVISGCANKNIVKKDEAMAPNAAAQGKQSDLKATKSVTPVIKAAEDSSGKDAMRKGTGKDLAAKTPPNSSEQLTSALEKIYFDFDSSALSGEARKGLSDNADYLRKRATAKLRIEGNCDERGSAEYNIALGQKRAEAAKKYLVTVGIPSDRLATVSYGKENPADPGHDESAWVRNRRDEFEIVSK